VLARRSRTTHSSSAVDRACAGHLEAHVLGGLLVRLPFKDNSQYLGPNRYWATARKLRHCGSKVAVQMVAAIVVAILWFAFNNICAVLGLHLNWEPSKSIDQRDKSACDREISGHFTRKRLESLSWGVQEVCELRNLKSDVKGSWHVFWGFGLDEWNACDRRTK
jgi:hypothetical protein